MDEAVNEASLFDGHMQPLLDGVARIVLGHSLLDHSISHLIGTFVGIHDVPLARCLLTTIDSGNKCRTLHALAATFKTGGDPQYFGDHPLAPPKVAQEFKRIANEFEVHSKVRNTVCHGVPNFRGDRLCVMSTTAPYFFKPDSGEKNWVFVDEMDKYVKAIVRTSKRAEALSNLFAESHAAQKK